jgi:hypothetical protein
MKRALLSILILCLFVNSGCVFKEFAYNHADYFLKRKIDEAFDLTSEQEKNVKIQLSALLKWHQANELKQYSFFLADCLVRLDDGLQNEDIEWVFEEVNRFRLSLLSQLYPPSALFLASLQANQLEVFKAYQAKSNAKRFEFLLKGDKVRFQKKTAESVKDQIEEWIGSLDKMKERIVEDWSAGHWEAAELKMQQTIKGQADLRTVLAKTLSPEDLEKALWQLTPTFDLKKSMEGHTRGGLYVTMASSLNPSQINNLQKQILNWKKTIDALAK